MPMGAQRPNAVSRALAAEIKAERAAIGLTREQVYTAGDMSRSTYARIEKGSLAVDAVQLSAIARVLGVPAWELWRRAEQRAQREEFSNLSESERAVLRAAMERRQEDPGSSVRPTTPR